MTKIDQSQMERAAETPAHPSAVLDDAQCPECGYSLRGLPDESRCCPECGEPLDPLRSRLPQIPWERSRGFFSAYAAYWRTIWLVMLNGRRFRAELARPVSYRAAQLFRFVTVGHVLLAALLMVVVVLAADFQPALNIWSQLDLFYVGLTYAGFVIFLITATGLPSYFFHPKHLPMARQNRGIALSYYTCGPLALSLLAPAFLGASLLLLGNAWRKREWNETVAESLLLWSTIGVPLCVVVVWWLSLLHLAHAALQSPARVVWLAVGFPMIAAAVGVVIFSVLPLLALYTAILFQAIT